MPVSSATLETTRHSIYTRPESLVGDQLAYMFSAACKYQILGLMAICEKQMEHTLTVANAAHCLYVADHVGAKSLKIACLKFIGEFFLLSLS
jgi:exosortase/archaeosortase